MRTLPKTIVVIALAAAGCFRNVRGPCDTPPPFYVKAEASPKVNPDARGRPLPTSLQLLQLKGIAAFEKKELTDLLQSPKDALGEEFLRVDELVLDPGQSFARWVERDPKAAYVVAVGIYRAPAGRGWRSIYELPLVPENQCQPQKGERTEKPQEEDVQLRLFLEESRIRVVGARENGTT